MTAKSQSMEDLKEQMELKRLYANCDQVSGFFPMISVWIICVIKAIKTLYQLVQTKCGLTNTLHCSSLQDLDFASQLVKQCHVSTEVLLEALRLLLPTLPESELLSISDALCPKQHPPSGSAEQEHPG